MTTQEYMQKQLNRHEKNYKQQKKRGAPKKDLEIINEKISHYKKVCDMLTKKEGTE